MERAKCDCIIVLLRHGETDYNKEGRLQGRLDIPLNETGKEQSREAANALRTLMDPLAPPLCDSVYSSPLSRAMDTAKTVTHFLGLNIPIICEEGIIEWNAGDIQGLRLKEIHAHYPHAYEQWAHVKDESYVFPNGESVIQRSRRVINALEGLARKNIGKRVVVFTHGGVLRDTLRRCL
eukprot:Protomagalhaensia_sp_Gyna_25__2750@NODE_2583_length_998_cov_275_153285_g2145_i0_p1_GENE_NODE_2583_length_998_cov_275_153285_g2145_i0NODE_2583_length_998_cov_275_153285_g2145_i0_p1_ORF_typecomplete_len179_score19_93His_Phos_1/PF00300_22/1_1e42_NODE_2583_length_998_cov_275_153285_g2145_i0334870